MLLTDIHLASVSNGRFAAAKGARILSTRDCALRCGKCSISAVSRAGDVAGNDPEMISRVWN
jgi:hypothetical protein